MAYQDRHPEQDPAEGSQETIDRELARLGMLDKPADTKDRPQTRTEPANRQADEERRPI